MYQPVRIYLGTQVQSPNLVGCSADCYRSVADEICEAYLKQRCDNHRKYFRARNEESGPRQGSNVPRSSHSPSSQAVSANVVTDWTAISPINHDQPLRLGLMHIRRSHGYSLISASRLIPQFRAYPPILPESSSQGTSENGRQKY